MSTAIECLNPQLDPTLPLRHVRTMRSIGYAVHEVPNIEQGIDFVTPRIGYSINIDIEPRPDGRVNDTPQHGMINFTQFLGIDNHNLLTPYPYQHTNKVAIVRDKKDTVFVADEGRAVPYDAEAEDPYFDGIIVAKNEDTKDMVLAFTGADCVPIVGHAQTFEGQEIIFGMHAGRKGSLTGVVENTIHQLRQMGVDMNTIVATVGAGAQAIEVPASIIDQELSLNTNELTAYAIGKTAVDMLKSSVIAVYPSLDEQQGDKALFDNQLDAAYRLAVCLGGAGSLHCVDANTITDDRFKSYRGETMAKNAKNFKLATKKSGRNMTFVSF